jgi:aryl-alcohol dehydrogenase-like predicted oxidoreductase
LETRTIGSLHVTVVGIGCNNFGWRIDARDTDAVVWVALDAGINFFDTADIYGTGQSEEFLGRALGLRRNEVIIATKFGMKMDERRLGARPEYVRQALEDSLKRLGTDRIDLYQLHQPDPSTPIADTLGALNDLVCQGKVREIGCSNFSAAQIREAEMAARSLGGACFESVQNQYSLMHREPEADVLPECERLGITFVPYFPLANGLLTGKYGSGKPVPPGSRADAGWGPKVFTQANLKKADALAAFAASRGHSLLELAFSWLLSKRAVASVIAGAKSAAQVAANAAAANWEISSEELAQIDLILAHA